MFSLADSNFYYLSFFMNTDPGVCVAGGGAGTGWRVTGGHGRARQGRTQVHERSYKAVYN